MIIDLTHTIMEGMPVYPGDEETRLEHSRQFGKDGYNNHQLSINMHAGTHIDGPMHLLDVVKYISEISAESFVGEGVLLDVSGAAAVDYRDEYEEVIKQSQIVILYTGHGEQYGRPEYFTDYPVLTADFVQLLIRKKIKMVGLDTPSPDHYPFESHKSLFRNQIFIIENLNNVNRLLGVKAFEIIALPLRIQADSSMARVIARVLE
ncbi:cyclase family protein [Paenibacillus sp. LHD-38]|uniref:cyclase family protein n=1 Tax=Paenibacillus sp. LHD-38 TaxID=3072143 RepID=UPI00280E2E9E|nr:cyclase family protein [Paenibacillus sp. LHD-38]MDQ8739083.1 cyclase family protein [Paenibacillus sp. LHD-38]